MKTRRSSSFSSSSLRASSRHRSSLPTEPLSPRSLEQLGPVSIECEVWRIFSHYSMSAPSGHPDALSQQMFFKMMIDAGVANRKIVRPSGTIEVAVEAEMDMDETHLSWNGGEGTNDTAIDHAQSDPARTIHARSSPTNSTSSSVTAMRRVERVTASHLPPPPCTPLRRSGIELIYINAIRTPLAPYLQLSRTPPFPPSIPAKPHVATKPTPSSKLTFELCCNALLAVALAYYGSPTASTSSNSLQPRAYDVASNTSLLERVLTEHILPFSYRWAPEPPLPADGPSTDVSGSNASKRHLGYLVAIASDNDFAATVQHYQSMLRDLFHYYADVGAQQQPSKSLKTAPSTPSSTSTQSTSLSPSALLSWSQWQMFVSDFQLNALLLSVQDLSRCFVMSAYERCRSCHSAWQTREQNMQSEQQTTTKGVATISDGSSSISSLLTSHSIYLNSTRLCLTADEFTRCILRCALLSMQKLGTFFQHANPSWML